MIRTASVFALVLALAATTAVAQAPADSTGARALDSLRTLPAPAVVAPAVAPAVAPTAPPPANAASILGPNSPTPARPRLVLPRAEAVIRGDHDQVLIVANGADSDLLEAKKRLVEAKGTVDIKKREIDTIAARVKAAKQAKDDATRATFDAERKRQESMRDFFVRAQDVADAAVDEAQARGDWAKASVRACDLELQLTGRAGVPSYDADPSVFLLEQQYLDAVKTRGAAEEKLANRTQTLVDRKLKLYKGWADYLGGK